MPSRCFFLMLTGLICLALLALATFALLPSDTRPGVTKANFDRVQKGMTTADLEKLFGRPPDMKNQGAWRGYTNWVWLNEEATAATIVIIDPDGIVKEGMGLGPPPEKGPLERFQHFIRWPWL